jgi:hypothetical protein
MQALFRYFDDMYSLNPTQLYALNIEICSQWTELSFYD